MKFDIAKIKDFSQLGNKNLVPVILVISVFLILDFSFVLSAQLKNYKNTSLKVKKLNSAIKAFQNDYLLMQKTGGKQKEQMFKTVQENDLSGFMEEIASLAHQNNIEISQIKPQRETKANTSLAGFIPYLFYLNINSDYWSLLRFIKDLEDHHAVISIEELDISQNPRDILKHSISLTLKVYVKK